MTTVPELIARIDAHEAEGVEIDKIMESMNLTPKTVKAIRKAEKVAEAAKKTLDELMGIDPATAEKVK